MRDCEQLRLAISQRPADTPGVRANAFDHARLEALRGREQAVLSREQAVSQRELVTQAVQAREEAVRQREEAVVLREAEMAVWQEEVTRERQHRLAADDRWTRLQGLLREGGISIT